MTTFAKGWKPRPYLEYNYASGDRDPRDGKVETFDQIYATAHDKYGLADQASWKNIHHARAGVEVRPRRKWMAGVSYGDLWLASARDALYNTSGTVIARSPQGTAGRWVGQELDAVALCAWSKQLQIGGGYGYLFPGTFLKRTTAGRGYGFPYLTLSTAF